MAIIAASVEANGWVLRLDVTGSLGNFASYALDPDGTARLALTSDHSGFAPSGGLAVAGILGRALIGTKPLRVAAEVVGTALQPARIDEVDLGGGVIRVRIALSEHLYATDTNLRLSVAAGWRTGETAASAIIVTNNSTIVAPIPIMRWALTPLSVVTGAFRLSLVVFSHHPNGFQPVAGVRFTVTDGTTTKAAWTTALTTDNSMGDNLRCYTLTIDPATATALTQGLLRCDAEVYPWLGSMRTTDTAGTRSMANLRADAVSVNAAAPFVVGYDPAGTRYNSFVAFVDPVNGTTTAATGMVQATLALARAVAPALRPKDINTALQAGYLGNRTLPAANGQASVTRSVDGMQIVMAAGNHTDGAGAGAVTFGINSPEMPVRITGDPDDSNPRTNCILQIQPSRPVNRATRVVLQRLTWEIGGAAMMGTGQQQIIVDDCIVRGKTGFETDTAVPLGGTVVAGTWSLAMTRSRWWRTGVTVSQASARMGLMRGCEHSRLVSAVQCALKNRVIPRTEDATLTAIQTGIAFSGWPAPTLPEQAEDMIVAYNDIRSWEGRVWAPTAVPAAISATVAPSVRRQAFVGNLCERIATTRPGSRISMPFLSIGEGLLITASYNIIEGNTFAGERVNMIYNEPPATTLADVNTLNSTSFVTRSAGNSFAYHGTKHDDFFLQTAADVRVANGQPANGYRPQLIGGWSFLYGVGHEGNAFLWNSWTTAAFAYLQYVGRRSYFTGSVPTVPVYIDDRSYDGSNAGGGNYFPAATSPVLGRVVRGQCDVDSNGTARPVLADAGVFQTVASMLVPAGARSGTTARSPITAWTAGLSPAAGRSAHRVAPAITRWTTGLLPAASRSAQRAAPAGTGWTTALVPASGRLAQRAAPANTGWTTGLVPAAGQSAQRVAPAMARWHTTILPMADRLVHRGQATTVGWRTAIVPANAMSGQHADATDLALIFGLAPAGVTLGLATMAAAVIPEASLTITPTASRLGTMATATLLLTSTAAIRATIIVAADPRSIISNRN